MSDPFITHEVFNQPPPFEDINLFTTDTALREAVLREGGGGGTEELVAFGAFCGSAGALENGRLANENPPRLEAFDARGHRLDMVKFHPAYHAAMTASFRQGLHCGSFEPGPGAGLGAAPRPGANVVRAAGSYLAAQMEAGHCCPVTMTNAAIPLFEKLPGLAPHWLPKVFSRTYDPRFAPATNKTSVTFGMGMTEKQGGTDVRANTTTAVPVAPGGGEYVLTGHKWFLSAPMSDAFFVLAQAPGGLTCFFLPRFLPDGSVNALRLERLKDKLGNRSNASSEAELAGAHAWRCGEEGRGVATIIEMVMLTRLDCAVSSAGLMRFALAEALHHCRYRHVSGRALIEHSLMRQVLADLALDAEAAVALAFRLARSFDQARSPAGAAWRRLMTPVTKYWVCKIAPGFAAEAMECLGGNGYTEALPLARLYREAPVNAIWEGSGNVMALDILRVFEREPETKDTALEELGTAARGEPVLEQAHERVMTLLRMPGDAAPRARTLAESLALLAAGTLLVRHAPPAVADAFLAKRVASGPARRIYGQDLGKADTDAILARAMPQEK